jgi:hypothetical protein
MFLKVRHGLPAGASEIRTIGPPGEASFRGRIVSVHPRQRKSRRERERRHEDTGRLRGTDGSNPAPSSGESIANPTSMVSLGGMHGRPRHRQCAHRPRRRAPKSRSPRRRRFSGSRGSASAVYSPARDWDQEPEFRIHQRVGARIRPQLSHPSRDARANMVAPACPIECGLIKQQRTMGANPPQFSWKSSRR